MLFFLSFRRLSPLSALIKIKIERAAEGEDDSGAPKGQAEEGSTEESGGEDGRTEAVLSPATDGSSRRDCCCPVAGCRRRRRSASPRGGSSRIKA